MSQTITHDRMKQIHMSVLNAHNHLNHTHATLEHSPRIWISLMPFAFDPFLSRSGSKCLTQLQIHCMWITGYFLELIIVDRWSQMFLNLSMKVTQEIHLRYMCTDTFNCCDELNLTFMDPSCKKKNKQNVLLDKYTSETLRSIFLCLTCHHSSIVWFHCGFGRYMLCCLGMVSMYNDVY